MASVTERFNTPVRPEALANTGNIVALIRWIEQEQEKTREKKKRLRVHKTAVCSGGCGTRFGWKHS